MDHCSCEVSRATVTPGPEQRSLDQNSSAPSLWGYAGGKEALRVDAVCESKQEGGESIVPTAHLHPTEVSKQPGNTLRGLPTESGRKGGPKRALAGNFPRFRRS